MPVRSRILSYILPAFSCSAVGLAMWLPSVGAPTPQGSSDGPREEKSSVKVRAGDARAGRDVFRFETFGNEGFWTDAARMPQGMKQARVTVLAAMKNGVNFDVDRIKPSLLRAITSECKTDLSPRNAPLLNDPNTMTKLVMSDAVIGFVAKRGKVGLSCALCHSMTDASVFSLDGKGGIGHRIDGPTQHALNVGKLLAICGNSRALYPTLQLENGGKTIGRAPKGFTTSSSEAAVDAYLSNPNYYPVGTFDDTPDGIGNSLQITPLFRQDLAGPYGTSGQNARLEDFGNAVYTLIFDQTDLTSSGGRAFLNAEAGAAGIKLAHDYTMVLRKTGVTGYPYVHAQPMGKSGEEATPAGKRVDEKKLLDMNAYLVSLQAPRGIVTDVAAVARGREVFRSSCTSCHNVDQSKPVPNFLVPMKRIFPGYEPTIIAKRKPPMSPVQNSPGTFDDKMIVVDASGRGEIRGVALPLLLDLARKPRFLHDDSVSSLEQLLDPRRGTRAPHPFYISNGLSRSDVLEFLKSLDTRR